MVPILTYHSQNIRGDRPADNDHAALASDLDALISAGKHIIPLDRLMDWLEGMSGQRIKTEWAGGGGCQGRKSQPDGLAGRDVGAGHQKLMGWQGGMSGLRIKT